MTQLDLRPHPRQVRRLIGDVLAVCQCAQPAAAARWTVTLAGHLPECLKAASLSPADRAWLAAGAKFRTPSGAIVSLPGPYSPGAREMYCRNVYLRRGLTMPSRGWVIDLGANHGLFSVWAAVSGAQVIAVEAQHGFAAEIHRLAAHNGVSGRVHVEVGMAGGIATPGSAVGVLADDEVWSGASHAGPTRPAGVSVPELISAYRVDRVGLMKVDIEGGEFAVLAAAEDLGWLGRVDQLVLEVHPGHGDVPALLDRLRRSGFAMELSDNDGNPVTPECERLAYAYFSRGEAAHA
jgi:FkbM family methyltransferase